MAALQPTSSPAGTTWVFLLAGQSNMAGRGRGGDLPGAAEEGERQREEPPVLRFTARGEWEEVGGYVSHADIDLRKADRCGVGPADSFARALRRSGLVPDSDRIGFVPCAVGGSSLAQWAPDAAPPPEDQRYFGPDCANFFQAAVQRTRAAVVGRGRSSAEDSGSSGGCTANVASASASASASAVAVLKGVLWYQGETDAMLGETAAEAETYGARFTSFVEALQSALAPLRSPRGPAPPIIPIFTVAVTACSGLPNRRPLPWLPIVRSAQLNVHLDCVSTIDAFGLRLDPSDGLHLTTPSQLSLGEKLCDAFVRQANCSEDPKTEEREQQTEWQWAVKASRRVAPELAELQRVYQEVQELEHAALLELSGDVSSSGGGGGGGGVGEGSPSKSGGTAFPLFTQKKRRMVNFVYGEIAPASVAALLSFVAPVAGDVLVDLGSGAGKVVLTAALLYPELAEARGVEMMEGYLRDARAATKLLRGAMRPCVQFIREDFLEGFESTWHDATIVFACSTCFDERTMEGIACYAAKLRAGARIITLDKILDGLHLVSVSQVHGSWGAAVARIYISLGHG